jgi:hypothetical protein
MTALTPAPQALIALAVESGSGLDPERLQQILAGAMTIGMPWGLVVTTVAQAIARGEDTRDIDTAVRSWRQTHPQGARP